VSCSPVAHCSPPASLRIRSEKSENPVLGVPTDSWQHSGMGLGVEPRPEGLDKYLTGVYPLDLEGLVDLSLGAVSSSSYEFDCYCWT
jgi:hypothetical protein